MCTNILRKRNTVGTKHLVFTIQFMCETFFTTNNGQCTRNYWETIGPWFIVRKERWHIYPGSSPNLRSSTVKKLTKSSAIGTADKVAVTTSSLSAPCETVVRTSLSPPMSSEGIFSAIRRHVWPRVLQSATNKVNKRFGGEAKTNAIPSTSVLWTGKNYVYCARVTCDRDFILAQRDRRSDIQHPFFESRKRRLVRLLSQGFDLIRTRLGDKRAALKFWN